MHTKGLAHVQEDSFILEPGAGSLIEETGTGAPGPGAGEEQAQLGKAGQGKAAGPPSGSGGGEVCSDCTRIRQEGAMNDATII